MKQAHLHLKQTQQLIKRCSYWKIFPFVINNGAIPLTETGYKPINSKISDFGQYELILTGNTPVVCIWKNSTKIYQKNKGKIDPVTHKPNGQDEFYTKQYKIGDYWNAYLIDDTSGVDFSNLPNNQIFKTVQTKRQYTLVMFEEHITIDDYLQFFVVFNDENENIGGNSGKNQDRQLLYISNVTNYYSPYNGAFSMQVLTFSSLNDRVISSGQNTLDFVQYASPGSGYAFPTIEKGKVTLNRTLMRDIGVRYSHRQSYGLELLSSCYYYGRPIIQGQEPIQQNNEEIFESKVFASRRLFIAGNNDLSTTDIKNNGGLLAGINDKITTSSHPETTFYNIMDAKPTGFTNFKDFKEWLKTSLNFQDNLFVTKDFKGMLAFDKDKATKSNGTAIGEAKFFWDSEWNINNLTGNYNVDMSSNFKYKDPDTHLIIGSPTVDYSKISQKYMSAILNFNSVVFSPLIQMPYDSNQWLPFALSDIPLIGKLLNALTLGIWSSWVITQNVQQYKKMLYFNGFMSAFFTSNLESIIGNGGLIPLNAFTNDNDFNIGKLLGANVSTTAMTMKLSDRISVYPWDPTTGHKLEVKEQISTVDLSQKKNNKVYILAEDTEFLDIASPFTNEDKDCQWNPTSNGVIDGSNYAYIIDTIVTQSLHQGEERHTFYSDNPFTYQGDYNEISVAQFRYNNMGALTGNAFNWTTLYKLNHDEYAETEETTFSYPAKILPPSPQNIAKSIIINPDLKIEMAANDVSLIKNGYSNIKEWENKNTSKFNKYEVDLNSLLDPTLLINTFNDLQRFYKSITIYYSYKFETISNFKNSDLTIIDINSETFTPSKEETTSITIDLKDLKINKSNFPDAGFFSKFGTVAPKEVTDYFANAYYKSISNYNVFTSYSLCNYSFDLKINKSYDSYEQKISNDYPIAFSIINNSEKLNWIIYLQGNLGKIEYTNSAQREPDKSWAYRYISNLKSNINKIVLNSR
ncbi:MAG: putative adhesin [Spiroplasma endosymbiont of Drosophila atripex]|nr:MAG: putative adhesin [Spiroplasma endosymbiont of Drosophila atripex]WDA54010.1 MAG: putative adhesin [Spiroplasma endosymbiont of Drosophila atripex]